ncbi:uncharacterized protein LOC119579855 [Penaeus monodon]|uniref:uncharacterized protein LOC119579855 n=1 Tax=Penaeus monodon TaxID=6687 RepID=UPI0018A70F75|nr:uncharacterized protein LOC119579855 [Penaeus monodon]
MFTDGDLAATARDGYEAFDCSRAVALIGFLGLLSNFQDIIDNIVNNGGRKRRRIASAPVPETRLCVFSFQKILTVLSVTPIGDTTPVTILSQPNFFVTQTSKIRVKRNNEFAFISFVSTRVIKIKGYSHKGHLEISTFYLKSQNDTKHESPQEKQGVFEEHSASPALLSDLARIGPQLALWVVDVADGRLPGERGHMNVCEVSRLLSRGHGSSGSLAAHLLTSTMAGALSSHTSSRKRLKDSGLLDGTSSCTY